MSQSLKMSAPSMQASCETMELFPSGSLRVGPARTSALRAQDLAWTAHARDYGARSPVWLASWESKGSCWKTAQTFLGSTGDLTLAEFSETWPRSGSMRNGTAYLLPPLTHPTSVIGSGSWRTGEKRLEDDPELSLLPTPISRDWKDSPGMSLEGVNPDGSHRDRVDTLPRAVFAGMWPTPTTSRGGQDTAALARGKSLNLAAAATLLPTPTASRRSGLQSHGSNVILGSLNPNWVEWLQGLPIGWTASGPSET